MAKLSICILVVAVVAASISGAPPSSSRPQTKCNRISTADWAAINEVDKPIKEACTKESSNKDGEDCLSKCGLEKYGFLDKEGRIVGKAVDDLFTKHTNATESFRKEVVALFENCAVEAGPPRKEIKQLNLNGTVLTKCKYEGLLHRCIKRGDIFKNNCSPNEEG